MSKTALNALTHSYNITATKGNRFMGNFELEERLSAIVLLLSPFNWYSYVFELDLYDLNWEFSMLVKKLALGANTTITL